MVTRTSAGAWSASVAGVDVDVAMADVAREVAGLPLPGAALPPNRVACPMHQLLGLGLGRRPQAQARAHDGDLVDVDGDHVRIEPPARHAGRREDAAPV